MLTYEIRFKCLTIALASVCCNSRYFSLKSRENWKWKLSLKNVSNKIWPSPYTQTHTVLFQEDSRRPNLCNIYILNVFHKILQYWILYCKNKNEHFKNTSDNFWFHFQPDSCKFTTNRLFSLICFLSEIIVLLVHVCVYSHALSVRISMLIFLNSIQ